MKLFLTITNIKSIGDDEVNTYRAKAMMIQLNPEPII